MMGDMQHAHGKKLAVMAASSFISMYVLMYMMVDRSENVIANINQFYMAAVMTGAMMLLEIGLMGSMYGKKAVIATAAAGAAALIIPFFLLRGQVAVSDRQFLKSMIPHHAAALLMCEEADLDDPEIKELCAKIVSGQQAEIDWMKSKLSTME